MDWQEKWRLKMNIGPDWREEYQRKMVTPEDAVKVIKQGDKVLFTIGREPRELCFALAVRKEELSNVRLFMGSPTFDFGWYDPGWEDSFEICVGFTFPRGVAADCLAERRADVFIGGLMLSSRLADV